MIITVSVFSMNKELTDVLSVMIIDKLMVLLLAAFFRKCALCEITGYLYTKIETETVVATLVFITCDVVMATKVQCCRFFCMGSLHC